MENKSFGLVNEKYVKVSGPLMQSADIFYDIVLYLKPVNAGRCVIVGHKIAAVKLRDVIRRSFTAYQMFQVFVTAILELVQIGCPDDRGSGSAIIPVAGNGNVKVIFDGNDLNHSCDCVGNRIILLCFKSVPVDLQNHAQLHSGEKDGIAQNRERTHIHTV